MIKNPFALIAERVRKSGDTMTGGLNIARTNTTTSTIHSTLELGNDTPNGTQGCTYGRLILRSNAGYGARVMARNLTAQRDYDFPDATGTLALTSDIKTKKITVNLDSVTWTYDSGSGRYYTTSANSYDVSGASEILSVCVGSTWSKINSNAIFTPYVNGTKISLMSNINSYNTGALVEFLVCYR